MIKKEYSEPTMEILKINVEAQILGVSVTDIITTGLDDDIDLGDENSDSWNDGY